MYSGLRTGASFVFDLDVTSRSAFDKWVVGQLEDQVSSRSPKGEMREQRAQLEPCDTVVLQQQRRISFERT
jgi:hypothetical protein